MPARRVLHVVQAMDDRLGGLQAAVISVANAQARAGHEVRIAAGQHDTDLHANLRELEPEIDLHLFRSRGVGSRFWSSPDLRRWLRDGVRHADVVHVHGVWALPPYLAARRAISSGTRLLVSPHGSLESFDVHKHRRVKRLLGPLLVRPVLNGAYRVVCTTAREADGLVDYGAKVPRAVVPLPPGATVPPAWTREQFRATHGIADDASVVLFVGRIDYKKGLDHLLDAMAMLTGDLSLHLVVVGDGSDDYVASIRRRVESLGIEDRVTFTGWLSGGEKSAAYGASDVFVLLSHNENYGITVIEATQHGLPVVLTGEVYTAPGLLDAGVAVQTTRDPAEAAVVLEALLRDPARMRAMRGACAHFVEDHLSEAAVSTAYTALLV